MYSITITFTNRAENQDQIFHDESSHSQIVGQSTNLIEHLYQAVNGHSKNQLTTLINISLSTNDLQTFRIYHKYPNGILNPAFTGIFLWQVSPNYDLNDYQLCEYHNKKSGIILHGREAYIFTQISNNDIQSHVKILFLGKICQTTYYLLLELQRLLLNMSVIMRHGWYFLQYHPFDMTYIKPWE